MRRSLLEEDEYAEDSVLQTRGSSGESVAADDYAEKHGDDDEELQQQSSDTSGLTPHQIEQLQRTAEAMMISNARSDALRKDPKPRLYRQQTVERNNITYKSEPVRPSVSKTVYPAPIHNGLQLSCVVLSRWVPYGDRPS